MNSLRNLGWFLTLLHSFDFSGFAQSSIITTYAGGGRPLPISDVPGGESTH